MLSALLFASGMSNATYAEKFSAPRTILIPAGSFITGSSKGEKEYAYTIDEEAYGHSATRQGAWYANEPLPKTVSLPEYEIMITPVTQRAYAKFVKDTGHRSPQIKKETWASYGLIHSYKATRPYQWKKARPPENFETHPVVLVSHKDAVLYARWLSQKTGQTWRLPVEHEWEKAARGTNERYFPWGNTFEPSKLNSHDAGKFGTSPVGNFPEGASQYGILDTAGQVYEWTSSPSGKNRYIVKGGSWDDKGCGVCRVSARHSRPKDIKHILIGFRLVRETRVSK